MPVTIESRTRRMQVFHVPHAVGCQERCTCTEQVVVTTVEHPRTGERARQSNRKLLPGSITFLALERKVSLPAGLLALAEVRAAIDRGYLRVIEQTPDPSADAATALVPPTATARLTPAVPEPPAPAAPPPSAAKSSSFMPGSPAVARKEPSP